MIADHCKQTVALCHIGSGGFRLGAPEAKLKWGLL